MSSMWWRRKPAKWHQSNRVRGTTPAGFLFRGKNRTGLPHQLRTARGPVRPYKRTINLGTPRTTGMGRQYTMHPIKSVSRYKTKGVSSSRHGFPFVLGRGGAPGRPIALGRGSGGKSTSLDRIRTFPRYKAGMSKKYYAKKFISRNRTGLAVAGGAAAIGAGGYAAHRVRKNRRTRRNYKGQFAGSY